MKRILTVLSILALLAPFAAFAGQGNGGPNGDRSRGCEVGNPNCPQPAPGPKGPNPRGGQGNAGCGLVVHDYLMSLPMLPLDNAEQQGLLFTREEEKLARDVYLSLYLDWGQPIFTKIARAEQKHMDAMGQLIDRYGLIDPVGNDVLGVFSNPELQALYHDLLALGRTSIEDALLVGATIEDLDLADVESQLEATDNPDLAMVYQNLAKGSRNHLRSFVSQLDLYDLSYEAQFLTPAELEEVLSTPPERGVVYDENGDVLLQCSQGGRGGRGGR